MNIYLIGSLRNPEIPQIASTLRVRGHSVYDDWISPGPEADDHWKEYEKKRGRSLPEALKGWHATHVFNDDLKHLDACDTGVLVLPAGRSAHMELGYLKGKGKKTYILLDSDPDRYDIMYRFADEVFLNLEDLLEALK